MQKTFGMEHVPKGLYYRDASGLSAAATDELEATGAGFSSQADPAGNASLLQPLETSGMRCDSEIEYLLPCPIGRVYPWKETRLTRPFGSKR